jgi:hypothetical protein
MVVACEHIVRPPCKRSAENAGMADPKTSIHVRCDRSGGGGWLCHVRVGADAAATTHEVVVTPEDVARLAPGADVEALVTASFRFLLEREPRESILRRFELPAIEGYFPEYAGEIGGRL